MKSEQTTLGGAVLLAPAERIDLANAEAFREALAAALAASGAGLIVDMAAVGYISSAGLRSLLVVFKASKAEAKQFAIAALPPMLIEIFKISGFSRVFPLFDTVRDAVAKIAPEALAEYDRGQ